ncbi:XkdQ/YqbQ family protein [Sporosarcina sp. FSL K6-1508]
MIDLTKVDYRLTLLPPSGSKIDITDLMQSAILEEMEGQVAAKLAVNIKNIKRDDGWIHQHAYLAKRMVLEATDGNGWKEVFRGSSFVWKTTSEDHTVDFIAYDPNYRLVTSKEHYYFKTGMTGAGSVKVIAGEWGIPLGKIDGPNVSLIKKMYRGYLSDTIKERFKESSEKGDSGYIVRSTLGKLDVVKEGMNSTVYELTDATTEGSSDEHSIDSGFVTRVKIYGNEAKEARPKVESVISGRTELGIMQEILYKSDFDNAGAAKAAGNAILKEKGKPEISRPLNHPDIPWIRKGDKVSVASGTIGSMKDGVQVGINCIVKSVTHDIVAKRMRLQLKG